MYLKGIIRNVLDRLGFHINSHIWSRSWSVLFWISLRHFGKMETVCRPPVQLPRRIAKPQPGSPHARIAQLAWGIGNRSQNVASDADRGSLVRQILVSRCSYPLRLPSRTQRTSTTKIFRPSSVHCRTNSCKGRLKFFRQNWYPSIGSQRRLLSANRNARCAVWARCRLQFQPGSVHDTTTPRMFAVKPLNIQHQSVKI